MRSFVIFVVVVVFIFLQELFDTNAFSDKNASQFRRPRHSP